MHAGDYRLLYEQCKLAMDARSVRVKQKIAAAYELETIKKDSRKAKVRQQQQRQPQHTYLPI